MSQTDSELLKKFQKILVISQEVKKSEVAKYLGLSEEELFGKLVEWGNLGFKLNKEYIIVENLAEFNAALDEQFVEWAEKEAQGFGKVDNLSPNLNIPLKTFQEQDDFSQYPSNYSPHINNTGDFNRINLKRDQSNSNSKNKRNSQLMFWTIIIIIGFLILNSLAG
jgi:hypothetical protein